MDEWIEELEDIEDFEELNNLENRKSTPYDKYFGEMDLTKEEKEKRKSFAEKLDDVMLFIFALITTMKAYNYINERYIKQRLNDMYSDMLKGYMNVDDYLDDYMFEFSEETIDSTLRNIDDEWYLSVDRAVLIAENEANSVYEHNSFTQAIAQGKHNKEWVDIKDSKERKSHRRVGGTVIPILQPFQVGNSLMMYAKDTSMGAEKCEVYGCRCTTKYF